MPRDRAFGDFGGPLTEGLTLFRARVAMQLAPSWLKRSNAMKNCGSAAAKIRCECGASHLVPFRCEARACPTCARATSARMTARLHNRARIALESRQIEKLWDGKGPQRRKGWKMLTLTTQAVGRRFDVDVLTERILRVRRAWGPFWRSTLWGRRVSVVINGPDADHPEIGRRRTKRARRDTIAIMGLEVAPGGMVHLHAAVYGEFVKSSVLAALWADAIGAHWHVHVRAMRAKTPADFEKALREVLKYVTKWDKNPDGREARAAAIEAAMRGVRRVETVGAIRSMPGVDAEVEQPREECGGCGESRAWKYVGFWRAEMVQLNGGFGPVVVSVDEYERREYTRAMELVQEIGMSPGAALDAARAERAAVPRDTQTRSKQ